ncbi:class I SAM-dependent methyltransferase [Catenulispora sp. NF23]|uniref:class I SAM-dependent methyltransferase n=1 Tax=Catenulispora pinistramenti TaxID=2705254 RepID=UPI001BAB2F89|nr:class I SAM-dependent methyltransferase [Catenulispora pinistramenti]MBS2536184.1 class I SAM-dependent methyltransferase [Catenulispora pinistramenti]
MARAEDRELWEKRYGEAQSVWGWAPNRFVAEVLGPLPAGRALDLAAGEGRNALWLADLGWRATAVDFAENALARGREQAEEHGLDVRWIHADVLDHQPEERAYDAVVIAYLHLPAEDLDTVLRNAAKALAPGGTLVVVGHDVTNIADGVGGPQNPDILYTPGLVTETLKQVKGLTVARAELVHRQTDRAPQPAIDTLVVARAG